MFARFRIVLVLLAATSLLAQSTSSFTALSLPSAVASAQPGIASERHLQATPVGSLCANSAFAHGFRHGYDDGFHDGDFAFQMGRDFASVSLPKDYRQSGRAYRSEFGGKESFDQGYKAGFRNGYDDAITGGEYRVRERMTAAADGLETVVLPPSRSAHFDEGVASGYRRAQTSDAPSQRMTADYLEQYCRKTASGMYALEYCSGFSRGYLLGMASPPAASTENADLQPSAH